MFNPKYEISAKLLENIKRITELVYDLNHKHFSKPVLMELTKRAHELSAYASTSIEGNPLPLTDVKQILKNHPKHARDSEKEVLNYNKALIFLDKLTKKKKVGFDLALLLKIHAMTMHGLMPTDKTGKLRKEAVFVNSPSEGKTVYWPPDHKDVNGLLTDLLTYLANNKNSVDPLILAGIFHKQFVIIHPFMDGNGRTVRLATKILLSAMGLNTFKLFSFENYYNKNVSKYFQYVGVRGNYYDTYKKINSTDWLEYFTDGILDELLRISKILNKKIIALENIIKKHHQKILDYLNKNDFITDKIYASITDRAKATRNKDFRHLISLGLIECVGRGKATIYRLK